MATLGIPKLQKLDDNKTVNQTLHNSKCTHVTQNRNWTSTTKMRLPDYLHALLLSHTHTLYPRTCHMGGTGDQRDIHTYMPEHHPVRRGIQGSAAWAKPLRITFLACSGAASALEKPGRAGFSAASALKEAVRACDSRSLLKSAGLGYTVL